MTHFIRIIVPVVGIVATSSVPLVRYTVREQHERRAIALVDELRAAQSALRLQSGGYAVDVETLLTACGGAPPLAVDVRPQLADADYELELRAAAGARVIGSDCAGHPLVSDYFVAASPASAASAARQAISGRSGGGLYVFFDGIAPREADLDSGLPTPVVARESFRIP